MVHSQIPNQITQPNQVPNQVDPKAPNGLQKLQKVAATANGFSIKADKDPIVTDVEGFSQKS